MIMKTKEEINGNKSLPNLPPHLIVKLAIWVALAALGMITWGGSFWAWFIGLWFAKFMVAAIIRFIIGCVIILLSSAFVLWLLVWLINYLIH